MSTHTPRWLADFSPDFTGFPPICIPTFCFPSNYPCLFPYHHSNHHIYSFARSYVLWPCIFQVLDIASNFIWDVKLSEPTSERRPLGCTNVSSPCSKFAFSLMTSRPFGCTMSLIQVVECPLETKSKEMKSFLDLSRTLWFYPTVRVYKLSIWFHLFILMLSSPLMLVSPRLGALQSTWTRLEVDHAPQ